MSVIWERLAGDTDRFALKLAFLRDPDDGAAASPEMSASWGRFQIWAGGRNLCLHDEEGEALDSVHWYLLPLMEWFVENWDPLLHEERLPSHPAAPDAAESVWMTQSCLYRASGDFRVEEEWYEWSQRHGLQAAREGGLFPNTFFRRWHDQVEVSWRDSPLAGAPEDYRFAQSAGMGRFVPDEVAHPLYDVLSAAAKELSRRLPESERVVHLSNSIASLKAASPARRSERVAWLAGLGRNASAVFSGWRRVTQEVERRSAERAPNFGRSVTSVIDAMIAPPADDLVVTGSCQAALLFGSLAPTVSETDVVTLADLLVDRYTPDPQRTRLFDFAGDRPVDASHESAWQQGYQLAEDMSEEFLGPDDGWMDVRGVLDQLGVAVDYVELEDPNVRAVALIGRAHEPWIAVNRNFPANSAPEALRFTLAHELCHLLFDRSYGSALAIASGKWAPVEVEQRADAFAAMFLMPRPLVQRAVARMTDPIATLGGVVHVASTLRTSVKATIFHLKNLDYYDGATRDRLRHQLRAPMEADTSMEP